MSNVLLDSKQAEYTWDGHKYPRVTSILASLNKPALVPAAVKATALYIESLVNAGADIDWIDVKREYRRGWDRKAADGTAVHLAIDAAISGQELDVELSPTQEQMMAQFYRWQRAFAPVYTATEVAVFNETHDYAGTADFIARLSDGRKLLFDVKTGKDLWPVMALQLAAYGHAEFMVHSGQRVPLPELDGWAVLHIRPDAFALREVRPELRDIAWRGFLAARQAHTWMEGDGKATGLVFDAPALPTETMIPADVA